MLKQCLENIGEGLLHACISSIDLKEPYEDLGFLYCFYIVFSRFFILFGKSIVPNFNSFISKSVFSIICSITCSMKQ
jgi:hypothetical protein